MKKSELIKELQQDILKTGDCELLEYKIVDAHEGKSGHKYSPTRKNKKGQRRKMSIKEFRAHIENKIENN